MKAKGIVKSYMGYAFRVLEKTEHDSIVITATGDAIVKALILIEMVKRRIGSLHQINEISSREIVDIFEPKIEGLELIEQKRRVTTLKTILSKTELNAQSIGYQQPIPKEERPRKFTDTKNETNQEGEDNGER